MRNVIIVLMVLICSFAATPKYAFTDEDPFEFADIHIAPIFNSGILGVYGGYLGGSGDFSDLPTAMDWSIGNTVPLSPAVTDDMVFSTTIGSWVNPADWRERMRITKDGKVGIGTTSPSTKLDINGNLKLGTWSEGMIFGPNATGKLVINSSSTFMAGSGITLLPAGHGAEPGIMKIDHGDYTAVAPNSYIGFRYLNNGNVTTQMRIISNGNVGIGLGLNSPNHPLEMGSGAHVTSGGVWTNASSRDYKENIRNLAIEEAKEVLDELRPTRFNYKADKEDEYLGFIAEEVPELVANKDRKGLSPMDIVAVLTKVVQRQQKDIEELKDENESVKVENEELKGKFISMESRLDDLEEMCLAISTLPKEKLVKQDHVILDEVQKTIQ